MNAVHTDKFGRKNGSGKLVPGAIIYNYGQFERKQLNIFDFLRIFLKNPINDFFKMNFLHDKKN